jgi:hypothetical protein
MPLARIDLRRGKTASYRRSIAAAAHRVLVETVGVVRIGGPREQDDLNGRPEDQR